MGRLKALKPRIQSLPPRLKQGSGTWRDGRTTAERGYGSQWQSARIRFLDDHPLCCYCTRNGRTILATVVDHIDPHKGNQAKFWDESNWQPLCKPCHDRVKAAEERAGAPGGYSGV